MKVIVPFIMAFLIVGSSLGRSWAQEEAPFSKESVIIEQEEEEGYFSLEEGDVFVGIGRIRIIHIISSTPGRLI